MNLSMLDREQLEDILLNPPRARRIRSSAPTASRSTCHPARPSARPASGMCSPPPTNCWFVRRTRRSSVGAYSTARPLVKDYFKVHFAGAERETFVVVFLDSQMRVIATEELFAGTLQQTSVYPREVVKRALHHNAGGVIFGHPHPSGQCEPRAPTSTSPRPSNPR